MTSKEIIYFIEGVEQACRDYEYEKSQVEMYDKQSQDYLHSLELDGLKYAERAKLATRFQRNRYNRRASKNTIELYRPIYEWATSDSGKRAMNTIKSVMGAVRKTENYHANRSYKKKVQERNENDERN